MTTLQPPSIMMFMIYTYYKSKVNYQLANSTQHTLIHFAEFDSLLVHIAEFDSSLIHFAEIEFSLIHFDAVESWSLHYVDVESSV